MALIKCSECDNFISNKTQRCLHCGYQPMGICKNCKWYVKLEWSDDKGWCKAAKKDCVSANKSVCPGVVGKFYSF